MGRSEESDREAEERKVERDGLPGEVSKYGTEELEKCI